MAAVDDERRQAPARVALEWGGIIVGAFVVALVIKTFLLQAFYIPSGSMEPTLNIGDRIVVNKLSDDVGDFERGEIVVFNRPPGEPESEVKDLIKRVVALPGETVESRDGRLVVDGQVLDEPYLDGDLTENVPRQTVPPGHLFVMGDNRGDSRDSRYFGSVDGSLLVGEAVVRVWPVTALDLL